MFLSAYTADVPVAPFHVDCWLVHGDPGHGHVCSFHRRILILIFLAAARLHVSSNIRLAEWTCRKTVTVFHAARHSEWVRNSVCSAVQSAMDRPAQTTLRALGRLSVTHPLTVTVQAAAAIAARSRVVGQSGNIVAHVGTAWRRRL